MGRNKTRGKDGVLHKKQREGLRGKKQRAGCSLGKKQNTNTQRGVRLAWKDITMSGNRMEFAGTGVLETKTGRAGVSKRVGDLWCFVSPKGQGIVWRNRIGEGVVLFAQREGSVLLRTKGERGVALGMALL